MALVSVAEAGRLVGRDRKTIYRHIQSGRLSATQNGEGTVSIETSELIRVYGELSQASQVAHGAASSRDEILSQAIRLFAERGYQGVSMRDLAAAVGMTPSGLYHHFTDKEQLYIDAVAHLTAKNEEALKAFKESGADPWEALGRFITRLVEFLHADRDYLRVTQWAMLDRDERLRRRLVKAVFRGIFDPVFDLAKQLAPGQDAHTVAISIISLVAYPFETQAARRFMSGYSAKQETAKAISQRVVNLLRFGLNGAPLRPKPSK